MAHADGIDLSLDTPNEFICPLTLEVLEDPVVAADGHTYEREAIEQWLRSPPATSPLTNIVLPDTSLRPNIALRNRIQGHGALQRQLQRLQAQVRAARAAAPWNPFAILELEASADGEPHARTTLAAVRRAFHERTASLGADEDEARSELRAAYVACYAIKQAVHYHGSPPSSASGKPKLTANVEARLREAAACEARRTAGTLRPHEPGLSDGLCPRSSPRLRALSKRVESGPALSSTAAPDGLCVTGRSLASVDPELHLTDTWETGLLRLERELPKITLLAVTLAEWEDVVASGGRDLIEATAHAEVGARGVLLSADLFGAFRRAAAAPGSQLVFCSMDKSDLHEAPGGACRVVRVPGTRSGTRAPVPELFLPVGDDDARAQVLHPSFCLQAGMPAWHTLEQLSEAVDAGMPEVEGYLVFYEALLRQQHGLAAAPPTGSPASAADKCAIM